MGADTSKMRDEGHWMCDGEPEDSDWYRRGRLMIDAATELEALRKGQAGPGVEERRRQLIDLYVPLVFQNMARIGPSYADMAKNTLVMAEAMLAVESTEGLAAERPPSSPTDASAYNLAHRHGQESGARRVLAAVEEWMNITTSWSEGDLRKWVERMKTAKWADGEGEG